MTLNRREYVRIALTVRCVVSSAAIGRTGCEGMTENISRNGLLIRVNGLPPGNLPEERDIIAVQILLPERRSFGRKSLRCRGNVVRIAKTADEGTQIAIAVKQMAFRTVGEKDGWKTGEHVWSEILHRA